MKILSLRILILLLSSVVLVGSLHAQWIKTGGPSGGLMTSLAVDPAGAGAFLAGTDGGGVFRSTDNGASWNLAGTELLGSYVTVVAACPGTGGSSSTLFAGTDSKGIFRSTDNGVSWTAVNSGLTNLWIYGIVSIGSTVFAGTYGGGIYRSSNNGDNWVLLNSGTPELNTIYTVAAFDTTLYVGTEGYGIYRSKDKGLTWKQLNRDLTDLYVYTFGLDGSRVLAGTSSSGVFQLQSDDSTWVQISNGLSDPSVYALVASGSSLFAGTYSGTFCSTDHGANWNPVGGSFSGVPVLALAATAGGVFAATAETGVFRSTNSGVTWDQINNGLTASWVYAVATGPDGSGGEVVLAGTRHGLFRSTDEGATWVEVTGGVPSPIYSLLASASGTFFAGTQNGVFRSTNGGATWTAAGMSSKILFALAEKPGASPRTIYAGSWGQGVYRSTDDGTTWTGINSGLTDPSIYTIAVRSSGAGEFLLAGTSGHGIFRSTDDGASWSAANTGLTATSIRSITITYNESDGTPVCVAGAYTGMYTSTDGGSTWSSSSTGLPNVYVSSVVVGAIPSELYAATIGGVALSRNYGATWAPANDGLSYKNVVSLAMSTGASLLAGTARSGIWSAPAASLPVQLSSFKAEAVSKGTVTLAWSTASELNNYGFEVQRSVSRTSGFKTVSPLIPGHGTTLEAHSYSYTDDAGMAGSYYRVKQSDLDGAVHYSEPIQATVTTGVASEATAPTTYALEQNWPNPWNPSTTIGYTVGGIGDQGSGTRNVKLTIYNVLGQEVAVLVNEKQAPGRYQVRFDGNRLPSGIYLYRLQAGGFVETKRMLLLR